MARGSAAGSIVTYLLEIANVDPIRYGLLFERFLNPERVNPPDIDIDFADDRRADVIAYVREKYGRECVAQIITFGTMGAKSVVRDVGRVMGLSYGECDRLAKMIPTDLKMSLEKALKQSPEFKEAYDTEETTRELVDTAMVLEDLARNSSVHAAGVVIGPEPLVNLLPLKQDEDGTLVTQYAMNPVGDLGLLKMDFLGLKTLTVIRNTCEMVKRTKGIEVPIDHLPLDDAKAYELLNKANTLGVFQLESGGMRDLCRKFQISSVEHITALVALYRPGPMDLIPEYIKRRNGEVKIEYEHPLLEPIAKETYGILVYQEQVMQAAQLLAGYTLGAADLLRRAMGKKKVEEMQKQRETFVKGAREKNNIPAAKANQIFDLLEKFAGYGFNKSHAAAYAVVAYQTAYLKANYPVEFLSAMMTNDMADTAKLSLYIAEARTMGIEVLAPDVNESQVVFAPAREGTVIRFGMAAVEGVGEVAVENILKARNEGGKFKSLADLCERVDGRTVNRKILEALIKSGACDCFGETRATLVAQIERTLSRAASIVSDRQKGQSSLFGMMHEKESPMPESLTETAGVAAARVAGGGEGVAGILCDGTSADAVRAHPEKIRAGEHRQAGGAAQSDHDAHRRIDRGGATWGFEEKRQGLLDGDPGGFAGVRGGAGDERELRKVPRTARAQQGDPGGGRGEHRRRQAEDFSAGNHAAGGCAEKIHQTGAPAPQHRAFEAGGRERGRRTRGRAPGQVPPVPLLHVSQRATGVCGDARAILRDTVARVTGGRRGALWRGDLLRQGGHGPARTPATALGTEGGQWEWGGVKRMNHPIYKVRSVKITGLHTCCRWDSTTEPSRRLIFSRCWRANYTVHCGPLLCSTRCALILKSIHWSGRERRGL